MTPPFNLKMVTDRVRVVDFHLGIPKAATDRQS